MKLTPMDINNKEFKKGLRGYNSEEVDEFLDEVVENYEEIYKENAALKEKLANLTEKVEYYSNIENTIQNTLLLAQNAAEQAKSSAKKEAELMVKNANETAQKVLDKAHNDVIVINDEYEKVKQEFTKFRSKYKNFLNTMMETFDDMEKDFMKSYNLVEKSKEEDHIVKNFNENTISEEDMTESEDKAVEEVLNEEKIEFKEIESVDNFSGEGSKPLNTEENIEDTMSIEAVNEELNQIKSFFAKDSDN